MGTGCGDTRKPSGRVLQLHTVLDPRRFVAVDVETGSRYPPRICSIAAVRMDDGQETALFHSVVAFSGRLRFSEIHGLTARDLAVAPRWPAVWRAFTGFITDTPDDIPTLVAYRAGFDRGALLSMCGLHGVRMPQLRFCCAAEMVKQRFGRNMSLWSAMREFELPFPGSPHDPRADARAVASILLACHG